MAERVRVAATSALAEGAALGVRAFGREIAIVRHEGRVFALDDVCPHRGGPMHQGEVVGGCLECPLHGWAFSLATGAGPRRQTLETFVAIEEDGSIYLEAPP